MLSACKKTILNNKNHKRSQTSLAPPLVSNLNTFLHYVTIEERNRFIPAMIKYLAREAVPIFLYITVEVGDITIYLCGRRQILYLIFSN